MRINVEDVHEDVSVLWRNRALAAESIESDEEKKAMKKASKRRGRGVN